MYSVQKKKEVIDYVLNNDVSCIKLNKKTHLCLVNRDVLNIVFIDTPHFCGRSSSIIIILKKYLKVKYIVRGTKITCTKL